MLMPERVLLSRLTLSPNICLNTNKIILRVCNSYEQALEKKMVSSANCKWDTLKKKKKQSFVPENKKQSTLLVVFTRFLTVVLKNNYTNVENDSK